MKKAKQIIAFLLSTLMILSLAACAGKTQETTVAETVEEITEAVETVPAPPKETETETAAEPQAEEAAQTQVTLLHPMISDYYECKQNDDNTFVYEIEAQILSLNEEEAEKYPAVDTALTEDLQEYIYQHIEEFIENYTQYKEDAETNDYPEGEFTERTFVERMDDRMCSILAETYEYLGGAHGYTMLQSFNYDSDKMRLVQLSEIVKDNAALQDILIEKLQEEYPENEYFDLENDIKNYVLDTPAAADKTAYTWTMGYDYISIWFPEEALGPHAIGSQEIILYFEDYPELFEYSYGSEPDDYVTELSPYYYYTIKDNKVYAKCNTDEYGTYTEVVFEINGTESSFEIFADKVSAYYLTTADEDYIYVLTQGNDDEELYTIYKVVGNDVTVDKQAAEGGLVKEYSSRSPVASGDYAAAQTYVLPVDAATMKAAIEE